MCCPANAPRCTWQQLKFVLKFGETTLREGPAAISKISADRQGCPPLLNMGRKISLARFPEKETWRWGDFCRLLMEDKTLAMCLNVSTQ